jgi:hypothetical protein
MKKDKSKIPLIKKIKALLDWMIFSYIANKNNLLTKKWKNINNLQQIETCHFLFRFGGSLGEGLNVDYSSYD